MVKDSFSETIFEYFWVFLSIFEYFWVFLSIFSRSSAITSTSKYTTHYTYKCKVTQPWDQIMENEFEYLSDRGVHGGHLSQNEVFWTSNNLKTIWLIALKLSFLWSLLELDIQFFLI